MAAMPGNLRKQNSRKYRLLCIDSDERVLLSLKRLFESAEYEVVCSGNPREAVAIAKIFRPHAIILEMTFPGMDGIEICHEIRQGKTLRDTLVIFYTSRNEDYSQIAAFTAGADDYIVKKIKTKLMLARLRALLRRTYELPEKRKMQSGLLRIDRERYLVLKGQEKIVLPRKEFELLSLMVASTGKVFTRQEIYREIWGGNYAGKNRTIDVHVRKLREKIGDGFIKTVKGIGYCFVAVA